MVSSFGAYFSTVNNHKSQNTVNPDDKSTINPFVIIWFVK